MRGELKPGYKQTEVGVIPEEWEVIDLARLCTLQRGFDITEATRVTGTVPVYSSSGLAYYHNKAMVSPPGVVTGRKGILGKVFLINEPFWPHDTTLWVKDFKGNHPAYVTLVLQNFHLEHLDAATSVPTLNRNNLAGHRIAVPPTKAEQEAIAEALSDADALIESLEQLLAKKRQTTKPGYKQTEVGMIPEDWEGTTVGEISDVKTGPFGSALHEKDYVNNGTPIITVEHLGESGVHHTNLPTVSDADKLRLKTYSLRQGDIVFSRVGSVDRNALIKVAEDGWLFSGRLLRVRLKGRDTDAPYLSYHFHSEAFKQRVRDVAVGQTMASINTQILMDVEIILPLTQAEQTAIATILTDMDAEIAVLEEKLAKAHQLKQGMMQELLTGKTRLMESAK